MKDPNERIMEMVRHALAADPKVTNRELLERARKLAPEAVEGLGLRQFHGRYRLPAARDRSAARRTARPARKKVEPSVRRAADPGSPARAEVREAFLQFAVELSSAERRADIVRAVARIDTWVERIVTALEKSRSKPPAARATRAAPAQPTPAKQTVPEPRESLGIEEKADAVPASPHATLSLSHDLEAFRRERFAREAGRLSGRHSPSRRLRTPADPPGGDETSST